MTIDFTVRVGRHRKQPARPTGDTQMPGRGASLLALAHRFEGLLASGAVKDYAELARLGHVSRARITQIMNLLNLAPAIQEYLLSIESPEGNSVKAISERHLRRILREVRWDHQIKCFQELVSAHRAHQGLSRP